MGTGLAEACRCLAMKLTRLFMIWRKCKKLGLAINWISYRETYWQWDILLAQIQRIKPDVLFFQDFHFAPLYNQIGFKEAIPLFKIGGYFSRISRDFPEFKQGTVHGGDVLSRVSYLMDYCLSADLRPVWCTIILMRAC